MSRPKHARPPRRSNAEYRWTPPRIRLFLRALAGSGSVAAAARVVGVSRQSAYRLRRRLGAGFAQVWDEGLAMGAQMRREGLRYDLKGDRWLVQGDTSPPQGDTFPVQGDTGGAR